jgi:hypothetical protein
VGEFLWVGVSAAGRVCSHRGGGAGSAFCCCWASRRLEVSKVEQSQSQGQWEGGKDRRGLAGGGAWLVEGPGWLRGLAG